MELWDINMIIKELDYNTYKGQKYQAEILSDRYLSIEPSDEGFDRYCYSNKGPEEHNMRVEMGKLL